MFDLFQIENEIITPQCCPFADGRRLRRLQMRETQTNQIAIFFRKTGQLINDSNQPALHELQTFPQLNQLGIIGDETTGRSVVDDPSGRRALIAIGMHMSHHVMPKFPLVIGGGFKIDIIDGRPQL